MTGGPSDPGLLLAYDAVVRAADAQFRDLDARLEHADAADMRSLEARREATTELIDLLESAVAICLERSLAGPGPGRG